MKLFFLILVVCCFTGVVFGQRRASRPDSTETESTPKTPIRRGRTRFVAPEDAAEPTPATQTARRTVAAVARRRPSSDSESPAPASRRNYEVEEVVDESPVEAFRRPHHGKTRVLTESRYEASNAPSANVLFQPSTTENLEEIIQSIGSDLIDASTTPLSPPLPSEDIAETSLKPVSSSSELPKIENEIRRETTRRQPESTTAAAPRSSESRRRVGVRRNNAAAAVRSEESTTSAARTRSRTRPSKKVEESVSTTSAPVAARANFRTSRRRPEAQAPSTESPPARTRGPSVIAASDAESPSRSRTGRRIPSAPEKITLELPQARNTRRNPARRAEASTESVKSARSRSRSRSRDVPPVIDEQKLEVLPLFESEAKTVRPLKKSLPNRGRSLNSAESVEMSATENDIHVAQKPEIKITTPSSNVVVSRKQSVVVETRTESSYKRRKPIINSKPVIKETVISEITEVTSKRTVNRKPASRANLPVTANKYKKIKIDEQPSKVTVSEVVTRGRKKSEINLSNVKKSKKLSSSEEEIDESDNYPAAFKALLQAKKQGGTESRPRQQHLEESAAVTQKTTERVVISSTTPPSSTTAIPRQEQVDDLENEVEAKPSSSPATLRPTRRRFTTTEKPTKRAFRTTVAANREHRFHAKFNKASGSEQEVTEKAAKSYSPKPRGLYSSRKNKEVVKTTSANLQIAAAPKKVNRYSSRYRTEASARATIRTSTSAPAYLPTIPTVTPSNTVNSPHEDKDLGLEIITFDDPVNTVPSANLVSGDYIASSTQNSLIAEAQIKSTEKPVSIIERIINSITAISTEAPVKATTMPISEPASEPLKESAILKLAAAKKPTKLDNKTQNNNLDKTTTQKSNLITTAAVTSEKPTTIIERILNSLSAIQAENNTETKNAKKVGTFTSNFNTISFPSTTPLSRVPKSTLSALSSSTSVNPLSVLDEISSEQTLQKRTIGKLLALLNTLTSTTDNPRTQQLVVVTPKKQFLSSISTTQETTTETTTTQEPLETTTTTTEPPALFTNSITTTQTIPTTTQSETTSQPSTIDNDILTTTSTSTTQDQNKELGIVLPLFVDPSVTSLVTESTTPSTISTTTDSSFSVGTTSPSTESSTDSIFTFPSTLPDVVNFEVSPGSVSIFSVNDLLSNALTPDETVTVISGRTNDSPTDSSTVSDSTTTDPVTVLSRLVESSTETDSATTTTTSTAPSSSIGSTLAPETTTSGAETTTMSSNNSTDTSENNISSNLIDTTTQNNLLSSNDTASNVGNSSSSSDNSNSNNNSTRSGRLLNVVQDAALESNSIETSNNSTDNDKDYFIFAVLNNNTILRKRPSRFPNKETPFLIVGVYPNSTIVRKFPNGTIVPMEPIIRVSGFDTRENPPTLPEITSNQVTPDQGSQPTDNKSLQTVEQNTIPTIEANALSLNSQISAENSTESSTEPQSTTTIEAKPTTLSSSSSSTETSTIIMSSSTNVDTTTIPSVTTTVGTTTSTVTLPTLTEILNGRTVQAFNNIINIADLTRNAASKESNTVPSTTEPSTTPQLSNRILENPTTSLPITTTPPPTTTQLLTTQPPTTTTPPPTTTDLPVTTTNPPTTSQRVFTTIFPTLLPAFRTSTGIPSTTLFPVFLQNLLSTLQTTTSEPKTTRPRVNFDLISASTTTSPVSTTPIFTTTFVPSSTARNARTTPSLQLSPDISKAIKGKELSEQQRKDLETIAQLEKEQQNLLKQLSFLTNLNLNGNNNRKPATTTTTTTEKSNLANRIIALAVERDNNKQTTQPPASSTTARQAKKIDPNQPIEEIVKQLNIATPSSVSSPYGNSNDAIIAALLKDQGIGPTTPKGLGDIYSQTTTTTRRPRTTTRPSGPLMQSLNWLLNALAPPTTKRPKPRAKPKPRPRKPEEEELLTHQPTHITPVVTAAPNLANSLSQNDIKKLINQLETIQKNPDGKNLDLSSIKSLQTLINSDQSRKSRQKTSSERVRVAKSTTSIPTVSVSNSIEDDEDVEIVSTTVRQKVPPLKLKPVPGVEEGPMVRGQLITAAVNVTRAISSFLGTALQDAAQQFTRLFASGSGSSSSLFSQGSLSPRN